MATVASMVTAGESDGSRKTYDFDCRVAVSTTAICKFVSTGWPTKAIAVDRGQEHIREHKTGADPNVKTVLASELRDFRKKHGLDDEGKLPEGAVRLEDI